MINFIKKVWRTMFVVDNKVEGIDPMNMENKIRKAARAIGRVQGVGFRFFVQTEAKKCRITGWVKNESDGSVTMEIQGEPTDINELEARIKRGNGFCKVNQFDVSDIAVVRGEDQFSIHY